jgi:hypothetical protein
MEEIKKKSVGRCRFRCPPAFHSLTRLRSKPFLPNFFLKLYLFSFSFSAPRVRDLRRARHRLRPDDRRDQERLVVSGGRGLYLHVLHITAVEQQNPMKRFISEEETRLLLLLLRAS